MPPRKLFLLLLACAACTVQQPACSPRPGRDQVWVLSRGWHTEIGIAANRLSGGLAVYRTVYPGARAVMFGYGKRTFMTAPADGFSEYLLGPFPGPAVIETVGLQDLPPAAYGLRGLVALELPPGGAERLSEFIWSDLARDRFGGPRLVGPGFFDGSRFYAATSTYDLAHTCNTWIVDALNAAGLPVSGDGVVFSGQVMAQVEAEAARQCRAGAGTR